jgi:hypothetical protein
VAEAVDAAAIGQTGSFHGAPEDPLGGTVGQRSIGMLRSRKEPVAGTCSSVIGAQFLQQTGGQKRVTVFLTFALDDAELVALSIQVFREEAAGFTEA